jgi:hypothetical protein
LAMPLTTRETVAIETPARSATSAIDTVLRGPLADCCAGDGRGLVFVIGW